VTEKGSTKLTVDDVVTERDVFRLAIRGFAVIEESITDGISEAFDAPLHRRASPRPPAATRRPVLATTGFLSSAAAPDCPECAEREFGRDPVQAAKRNAEA